MYYNILYRLLWLVFQKSALFWWFFQKSVSAIIDKYELFFWNILFPNWKLMLTMTSFNWELRSTDTVWTNELNSTKTLLKRVPWFNETITKSGTVIHWTTNKSGLKSTGPLQIYNIYVKMTKTILNIIESDIISQKWDKMDVE